MNILKKSLKNRLIKLLNKSDIDKELIPLISEHSFINLNKEFKILPSIELPVDEIQIIELKINELRNTRKFKKLFKRVSKEKNKKYQNLFYLNDVVLLIDKTEDGIKLSCDKKHKKTVKFIQSKLLNRIIDSDGLVVSLDDFELIFPEIEKLKKIGINVVFKNGKTKAKVGIFPVDNESYFSKDDIFKRKILIDDELVDLAEFKEHVRNKQLFYKNKLVEVDENILKELEKQEELTYLDVVKETLTEDSNLKEFILEKIKHKEINIPKMNNITLEEYQKEGVKWLVNNALNGFGSILADDMGLGKTIQTITAIQALKEELKHIKVLVIVPTAVLLNWEYEIKSFSTLSSSFYYGSKKDIEETDIVLTTYGTVTYDEFLKNEEWDLIVIDEAQKIKNHDAIITNKINLIPSNSKIALTGTPVENNLMDLWSIFNFIIPGYLGSKKDFKSKYGKKYLVEEELSYLKKVINPFILRREKSILSLPEKIVKNVLIKLTKEQEIIYNELVEKSLYELELLKDQPGKRLGLILSTITRLKQVCNHPANLSDEFIDIESAKINQLKEIVKNVREKKEKIIIFTQYVTMANLILNEFKDGLIFHGGLNIEERLEVLSEFKTDKKDILIISLKAGGAGLNIVEANHVVHYDLWFNPAVENQATDRAYRRGQKKDVYVYRFISEGTFEEKINNMIVSKKDLFDKTMNGNNLSFLSRMDDGELREIFSFGRK